MVFVADEMCDKKWRCTESSDAESGSLSFRKLGWWETEIEDAVWSSPALSVAHFFEIRIQGIGAPSTIQFNSPQFPEQTVVVL
jgi:hypothetical protein